MEWLYYLLEANLYLLLFYGFYKLILANTTFYSSNRYYLLLSSITAFVIPLLRLGILVPTQIVDDLLFPPPIRYSEAELAKLAATPIQDTISFTSFLYPLYLMVACFFAIKLTFSIIKIVQLWLKANKKTSGKITIVELNNEKSAFSFFNLLFIHPHLAETKAVLRHEMVHIKQKHSVDILFFEILQVVCWFNPLTYFLKKDIKLVHEFIADELSTGAEMQNHEYAMFLIENAFGVRSTALTNQLFNQSILKRRINMLNKKRTASRARLRLLLVLPLSAAMLCTSTMAFTKDYGYLDLLPKEASFQEPMTVAEYEAKMVKEKFYYSSYIFDKNNQYESLEKRLIIVNGVPIKDNNKYNGNSNADKIIFLTAKNAVAKYGVKAKYGAVEIYGTKSKLIFRPIYKIADTARFPRPIDPPAPAKQIVKPSAPPSPPIAKPHRKIKT